MKLLVLLLFSTVAIAQDCATSDKATEFLAGKVIEQAQYIKLLEKLHDADMADKEQMVKRFNALVDLNNQAMAGWKETAKLLEKANHRRAVPVFTIPPAVEPVQPMSISCTSQRSGDLTFTTCN